jgi:hypothetical protein
MYVRFASSEEGVSGLLPRRGVPWTRTAGERGGRGSCWTGARLARLGIAPAEGVGAAVRVHHRVGRVDALEVLHRREGREALDLRGRGEPAGRAGEEVAVAARGEAESASGLHRRIPSALEPGTHM